MSDPADEASIIEEAFTQRSIDAARKKSAPPSIPFIGECHNCGDEIQEPLRFCDVECKEEWEYVRNRKRANGKS